MPQPGVIEDFRRYSGAIRAGAAAVPAFAPEAENATAVQVERGIIFADLLMRRDGFDTTPIERLIELSSSDRLARLAIVDRSGHHRPVYRALLVYSWLRAFAAVYESLPRQQFGRWEEGLRPWCDLLEADLGTIEFNAGPIPAARGASAAECAWMALTLHLAGRLFVRDAWTDLASDSFGRITRAQLDAGPFLQATSRDNPETHWYHELVILHAVASYAVQAEDRVLAAAVARNTDFHQHQTQPDHATTQPWALFAFIWNPSTRAMADQLLHGWTIQNTAARDGVSLMLLADALYCLELFTG